MHHNDHTLNFLKNRKLNELYISVGVKSFAVSMVTIFIPIYLLQIGFSLSSVLIFFATNSFFHGLFTLPAAMIGAKKGFKHLILYSIPLLIISLFMLYTIDIYGWPLYLIAILFGAYGALFWMGYHTDFAKFSEGKKRGSQISSATIIFSLFAVAGPLVGGLILTYLGFSILFLVVSVLLFSATIPLFWSKDLHSPAKFNIKGIVKGREIKDTVSFIGFGFERVMAGVIWPIFIFLFILGEKYTSLGAVTSLSLLSSMVVVFLVGKFSDKRRRLILRMGSVGTAIVWFFRTAIVTPIQVFIVDLFYGGTNAMAQVSFDAITYDKANREVIVKYTLYREMVINFARTIMFLLMIFVVDLTSGFIFGGALGSLLRLAF